MKQKLFLTLSLITVIFVTGCQPTEAPITKNQDVSNVNSPASTNNQTNNDANIQSIEKETNKAVDNKPSSTSEESGKFAIIFKMIGDGLEISQTKETEKPGIAMIERGINLINEAAAKLELSDKIKNELEAMQKGLAQLKEGKNIKEANQAIEKALAEMKTKLGVQ